MKISIRHLSRHGRFMLVLMLALASFLPGIVHAAAMSGSSAGNGHHMTMDSSMSMSGHRSGHASADQPLTSDVYAGDVQKSSTELPSPMDADKNANPCCPMACSVALCLFEPVTASIFTPDLFETGIMHGFVVGDMAMPDRPPRI